MDGLSKGIYLFNSLIIRQTSFSITNNVNVIFIFKIDILALRISLIQMKTGMSKLENVANACSRIRETIEKDKPKIVALPECFNAPYGNKYFDEYAETVPDGYTCKALSNIAKELKVFLVGGTIPERDNNDNKLYNTCTVWSPSGDLIAKYRKVISNNGFGAPQKMSFVFFSIR